MTVIKKIIIIISIIIFVILLLPSCSKNEEEEIIYPEGTFIQAWLLKYYNDQDYIREFQNLKHLKIKYLIFMNAAEIDYSGNYSHVAYPSADEKLISEDFNTDILDKVLYYCSEFDIKCYVGLINDSRWWLNYDLTYNAQRDMFINSCLLMCNVLEEVYGLYHEKYQSFYGEYFPTELFNCSLYRNADKRALYAENASKGINSIIDKIESLDGQMPLLFSPFINPDRNYSSAEDNGLFYLDLINKTNFRSHDIFCPQDSIGARNFPVDDIYPWYEGYKDAVNRANKKITFGINCECFATQTKNPNYLYPADIKTFVLQLKAAKEYSDFLISFALPHYYNDNLTLEGFKKSYLNYLATGAVEDTPPSAVENFLGVISGNSIALSWQPSSDEYSIAGYNITRYDNQGQEIEEILIRAGVFEQKNIDCAYTFAYNQGDYYSLAAMDCSGNFSSKTYYLKP